MGEFTEVRARCSTTSSGNRRVGVVALPTGEFHGVKKASVFCQFLSLEGLNCETSNDGIVTCSAVPASDRFVICSSYVRWSSTGRIIAVMLKRDSIDPVDRLVAAGESCSQVSARTREIVVRARIRRSGAFDQMFFATHQGTREWVRSVDAG